MVGRVPQDELLAWYNAADVYVSLSRHEAFGMTLLEAAMSGAAIVASDIPAHREVADYLPHGRVVFVSPDCPPLDLAQAIQKAAGLGRVADTAGWPLPTWADAVDHALSCYHTVLTQV
jgi:glycosyltransferase involved in cell wall biosynthesis